MRCRAIVFALIGALAAGALAIGLAVRAVTRILDPCVQWGMDTPAGSVSMVLPAGGQGPCANRIEGTPETKEHAVILLLLVNGGLLISSVLAVAGAAGSRQVICVIAAVIMLLESMLAMSIFPLTFLATGFFLMAARETAARRRSAGSAD